MGVIHCRKYNLYLYDVNNSSSVKPKRKLSEKQKLNIKKITEINKKRRKQQRWEEYRYSLAYDRCMAIGYARQLLRHKNFVILDTERAGMCRNS